MELKNPAEHRQSVLEKVDNYLKGVAENILMQPESEERRAFILLVANIGRLLETMQRVKGNEEFIEAVDELNAILDEHFFTPIYGPLKEEKANPSISDLLGKDEDIQVHFGVIGSAEGMPKEIKDQLKQMLRSMGISKNEIDAKLGE